MVCDHKWLRVFIQIVNIEYPVCAVFWVLKGEKKDPWPEIILHHFTFAATLKQQMESHILGIYCIYRNRICLKNTICASSCRAHASLHCKFFPHVPLIYSNGVMWLIASWKGSPMPKCNIIPTSAPYLCHQMLQCVHIQDRRVWRWFCCPQISDVQ